MRGLLKRFLGTAGETTEILAAEPSVFIPPSGSYRFIALDVETANSSNSSICQIGLAACDERGMLQTFGTLINPRATFEAMNIGIHGITSDMVQGAPTFAEVMRVLRPVLETHTVFQHSNFDKAAINAACTEAAMPLPSIDWRDSVQVARRAWPELKGNGGHGLAHLKQVLELEFEHHDALEDARAAAEVVLRAEQHTGQTFREILAPRPPKAWSKAVTAEGATDGPLYGQIAVFTGALSMSREQAANHAAEAGITVKGSVTKKTTLLIVGDQDLSLLAGHTKSAKHRRAEELIAEGLEIRILAESEFLTLIGKS